MPKYNETSVIGESWTRANRITCTNDYRNNPSIFYHEEELFNFSDGKVVKTPFNSLNPVSETFTSTNANTTFELINPATELPTGNTATYQDLYVLIHSLYFHLAKRRDKGNKPFPSWVWSDITNSWLAPVSKPETGTWIWDEEFQQWVEQP